VFIDTLSFEAYRENQPWVAYRQFCQHFLAPLALMSKVDVRLGQLLRVHLDGVPLDLAARLLPGSSRLRPSMLLHIHLHAMAQRRFDSARGRPASGRFSKTAFLGMLDSLSGAIAALRWNPAGTEWADYYQDTNYSAQAHARKRELVASFLEQTQAATVWDLGANTGELSRIASARGIPTMSFDVDPACVERNYLEASRRAELHLLPLLLDLTNPSSALGWRNRERMSLVERGPAGAILALALIHHIAISNNVPLLEVADWLARLCRWLIIEFVPKTDTQVRRLLVVREDIFPDYHRAGFEESFARAFSIERMEPIGDSERILYLMRSRNANGSVT
jgi:hypothetical protein